ncbi:MAG: hypothetical protein U0640_00760 [Phycisphaerales bacterium]
MPIRQHNLIILIAVASVCLLTGCKRGEQTSAADSHEHEEQAITNRVDISQAVRQNLGITFAKVEQRNVARTLRIPGRFELLPSAKREYRAHATGRVELLVTQFAKVETGTALYRFDSPQWRQMQRELTDARASVRLAKASADSIAPLLDAHEKHHVELQKSVDLWTTRVASLEQLIAAGGARADDVAAAKASLASARSDLAETLEKEAELETKRKEASATLEAADARLQYLFRAAASMTGLSAEQLQDLAPITSEKNAGIDPATPEVWQQLDWIEVRAIAPGVVDAVHVASGGVVDEHGAVLDVVQPEMVRFRSVALQSDLPRLADGQHAQIVGAQVGTRENTGIDGTLTVAPTANADRRTVDLIVAPSNQEVPVWARAGVAAFVEVVTSGTSNDSAELAIPLRCVARDGTQAIIFRRDPANPDKAIRLEADLGIDDGRWIVIKSGVGEGNEIVLDGVYQLMVATSGNITKGGHFHPDGSFHEGEH